MRRRIVILTIASAVVFLFTCLAYADIFVCPDVSAKCPKQSVCIVHPKGNEHMVPEEDWYTPPWPPVWPHLPLVSGATYQVVVKVNPLAFPTNNPVVSYTLFYSLNVGVAPWKPIATRYCSPQSHCYPCYPWIVPVVGSPQTNCKVKVVLYGADGKTLGSAVSSSPFTIVPAATPEAPIEP